MNVLAKGWSLVIGGTLALGPSVGYACGKCFGAGADSPTTYGISMAMLSLLLMMGVVWGGLGAFFIQVRRRTKQREPGAYVISETGTLESTPSDPEQNA